MKKILITFLLFFASAQVMAADPITPDQEQRAQKLIYDFLFNDPDSPRIGAKNPTLTLVVFTDYNCPYCKKFDPYLEKIVEKHPQVAVVFKFLPFRSESSLTAARDALTVWRSHPEQFMKFNETLMAKKGYHDDASIQEAQKRAGVNVATPDDTSLVTVKRSLIIAEKLGIQGTPATLIGEGLLPGWVPFEQFDEMVTDALKNR
ncbi:MULTISPECIES: DsbA family protein [Enterobacter]|jgi:protein-disulfide isomerase|uniref:DsbA family protein n=1 Tax=Enterobacter TaxID=547 RepID=UPI00039EB38F|nr:MULTISPECIES: DsbA family protein [Enterobacter]EKT9189339.1 thioredoxin domain-containing protein [Enterobacter cloacae]EKU3857782.1 thioredoxin domain-containing protein [Enterobacter cloacae]EKX9061883.1 thioredoxin domain-containing protein [Enterobacter cloacae]ELK7547039.1 thioredoxin domain-containing protein [Enterobacter cloacae]ELR9202173.1 thioredoxin domain-containing protein [Enterobacter cloacae]